MPVKSEFRSNPVRRAFRERIQFHQLNRLRGSCSNSSCFFTHRSKLGKRINFCRLKCFSSSSNNNNNKSDNNDVDGGEGESGGNASKDSSNTTTTTLPEPEQRRETGFNSEKSSSPSPSPRVIFFFGLK